MGEVLTLKPERRIYRFTSTPCAQNYPHTSFFFIFLLTIKEMQEEIGELKADEMFGF